MFFSNGVTMIDIFSNSAKQKFIRIDFFLNKENNTYKNLLKKSTFSALSKAENQHYFWPLLKLKKSSS